MIMPPEAAPVPRPVGANGAVAVLPDSLGTYVSLVEQGASRQQLITCLSRRRWRRHRGPLMIEVESLPMAIRTVRLTKTTAEVDFHLVNQRLQQIILLVSEQFERPEMLARGRAGAEAVLTRLLGPPSAQKPPAASDSQTTAWRDGSVVGELKTYQAGPISKLEITLERATPAVPAMSEERGWNLYTWYNRRVGSSNLP
jgi:hypothetical protein